MTEVLADPRLKFAVLLAFVLAGALWAPAHDPSIFERVAWAGGLALGFGFLDFLWVSGSRAMRWSILVGALLGLLLMGVEAPGSESPITQVGGILVGAVGGASLAGLFAWGWLRTLSPRVLPEDYRDPEPAALPPTPVPLAEWELRAAGRFCDLALVLAATQLLGTHVLKVGFFPYFGGLWILWEVPLMATQGRTPTKVVFRTRVVDVNTGSCQLGLRRASVRWLTLMLNLPFAFLATHVVGDVLWALKPGLSLEKGVAAGTVEVSEADFRRLRAMVPTERVRLLEKTRRIIEAVEPEMSRGVAIATTVFVIAGVGTAIVLSFV